jgi:hypothetical protein
MVAAAHHACILRQQLLHAHFSSQQTQCACTSSNARAAVPGFQMLSTGSSTWYAVELIASELDNGAVVQARPDRMHMVQEACPCRDVQ